MKFAQHLVAHITPEWRKQYISYEEMKAMLYTAVEQAPSSEVTEESAIVRYYARFDEQFFRVCDKELAKINTFFSEKMAEATRKFNSLKSDLQTSKEQYGEVLKDRTGLNFLTKLNVPTRKTQDLKLAFSEFYLSLILLQNYQNINFTGFRKIFKKHDKLLSQENGAKWREKNVDSSPLNTNKDIDKLIQECEGTFTSEFEQGDRAKAMKRLRVPPLGQAQSPWTTFKVGLFSGALLVLLVAILISAVFPTQTTTTPSETSSAEDKIDWEVTLRLFRAPLLIFIFIFCIGCNVYGWRSSGVNHVLIFEIDPRNHVTEQHLIELAAIFGVIWALCVLGFLYARNIGISPYYIPLLLIISMVVFLFNPSKTFHHEARFWLLRKLGRMICAPFFFVQFADFWLADQFNTLDRVLVDFEHTICFYLNHVKWEQSDEETNFYQLPSNGNVSCASDFRWSSAIIRYLPAWWRFAQCLRRYRDTKEAFPHLLNALKYSTTFFVVTFSDLYDPNQYANQASNPFIYLLIISRITASCFGIWWDLVMDWGLFDKNSGEYKFLREEMVYSSPYYYYLAIVEDVVLRFSWCVPFTVSEIRRKRPDSWLGTSELMITVVAVFEVLRRFFWNFFRLENEHLNNCGKFRAVRDISITPLDASDQAQIVKMMDEEDGVVNRRRKKLGGKTIKTTEQRPLIEPGGGGSGGDNGDEESNILTVTSADLKNWVKGIAGHKSTLP